MYFLATIRPAARITAEKAIHIHPVRSELGASAPFMSKVKFSLGICMVSVNLSGIFGGIFSEGIVSEDILSEDPPDIASIGVFSDGLPDIASIGIVSEDPPDIASISVFSDGLPDILPLKPPLPPSMEPISARVMAEASA